MKKIYYGYVIVFCCALIMAVNVGIVMSSAGIFYKPVSEDLGVSVGRFGIYMSFNYLFSTLAMPFAGRLMEKYNVRALLSASSAVLGLTLVSMSFFQEVWHFYAAGAVIGITLSFLLYLGYPIMVNRWFKARVGFFIGICSAASGIGGVLFNPVAAWLIKLYGWRTAYLVFGLVILLAVSLLLALLLRGFPADLGLAPYGSESNAHSHQSPQQEVSVPYARAVKLPVFYLIFGFTLLMISVATLNLFIPHYVTSINFSIEQAAYAGSAIMLGATIGKVALGLINDRSVSAGVLTMALCGMLGLGMLIMGGNILVVIAGGFLFGWAYAGGTVQMIMLVRHVFGSSDYARIYSTISIALAIGGAIMSGAWGLIADRTSYALILSLGIACLLACLAIGLYAIVYRKRHIANEAWPNPSEQ